MSNLGRKYCFSHLRQFKLFRNEFCNDKYCECMLSNGNCDPIQTECQQDEYGCRQIIKEKRYNNHCSNWAPTLLEVPSCRVRREAFPVPDQTTGSEYYDYGFINICIIHVFVIGIMLNTKLV